MTTYGTIPISSSSAESPAPPSSRSKPSRISRAERRIKATLGTYRPWKIMFSFSSFALPAGLTDAVSRIRINIAYFRLNYAVIALLFLLPLYPLSLFVFSIAVWLFLYFLRYCPTPVIFGLPIGDRVMLMAILVPTVVVLLMIQTSVAALIIMVVILVVEAAVLVTHAALTKTEDLILEEEEEEEEEASRIMSNAVATSVAACATGPMPPENINI